MCQDRHHLLVIVVLLVIILAQVQVRVLLSLPCGTGAVYGTQQVVAVVDVVMLAHHRCVVHHAADREQVAAESVHTTETYFERCTSMKR